MNVSKNDFVERYNNRAIDVNRARENQNISEGVGNHIARADTNRDGRVQGRDELEGLFNRLDNYDSNGSYHSIAVRDANGQKNALGRVLDGLDQSTVAATQTRTEPRTINRPRPGSVDATRSTAGMSESQRFDHYRNLIEANGGEFKTGPNQRNIVSLRRETDADVNGGNGRYDDTTAMLWTDSQGRQHVREYTSNTEPSARYRGSIGVDANGDGRKDQGRLPEGFYEYRTGHSSSLGRVLRPTQNTNAERDTNHDGLFNDGVMASAGQSMLFHAGGRNMTGSAGCQTMSPEVYNQFWSDLNSNGNPGNIGYTLINM
ncbi:MAG: hypothetical protein EP343_21325 [Deltaproteobacteria bacterium]|nr:MAG: hypothetical protein EP343_21325 [Deltaproteobacteria bacterium]